MFLGGTVLPRVKQGGGCHRPRTQRSQDLFVSSRQQAYGAATTSALSRLPTVGLGLRSPAPRAAEPAPGFASSPLRLPSAGVVG